jgi:acetyltransferase-like isoleucine patch superfamily enzyme
MDNRLGLRRVGEDVTIWPLAKIVTPENIVLGDSVIIDDLVLLFGGKNTQIGSFVHIGSFTSILGGGELTMGDFTGIGSGCRIITGGEDFSGGHLTNPTVDSPFRIPIRSFVEIGKHAIITTNVVILSGVKIGEGVVVGANSLVRNDCDPWTIYAGSPAKPIRSRPKEKILALEAEYRKVCYDSEGNYIPRRMRRNPTEEQQSVSP